MKRIHPSSQIFGQMGSDNDSQLSGGINVITLDKKGVKQIFIFKLGVVDFSADKRGYRRNRKKPEESGIYPRLTRLHVI